MTGLPKVYLSPHVVHLLDENPDPEGWTCEDGFILLHGVKTYEIVKTDVPSFKSH